MTAATRTAPEAIRHPVIDHGTFLEAGWWLTTREAGAELGLHPRTVWKAITDGHLTSRLVGRRHLIAAAEVARYRDRRAAAVPRPSSMQRHKGTAAADKQSYPAGAPKRPLTVVYHHVDGSTHHLTRYRAEVLEALKAHNGIMPEGALVNRLYDTGWGGGSRRRIIRSIDALTLATLIMRGEGRDRKGGPVATAWITLRGADALRYCQERGLL